MCVFALGVYRTYVCVGPKVDEVLASQYTHMHTPTPTHTHTHAHMHTCTCVYIYIEEDPRETIRIVWGFQLYEVLSKLRVTVSGRCFVNVGQGGTTTPLSISEI